MPQIRYQNYSYCRLEVDFEEVSQPVCQNVQKEAKIHF